MPRLFPLPLPLLFFVFLFSCKSTGIKSTSPKSVESTPQVEVLLPPQAAVLHFPPPVEENAEFRQIQLCKEEHCSQINTLQDQELILTPEKGTYTASVAICSHTGCNTSVPLPPVLVSETSQEKMQLKSEFETLQDTASKQLVQVRQNLQEWSNDCSQTPENKKSVEHLLSLHDAVLLYILGNLTDLPLDDSEELELLAQKYEDAKSISQVPIAEDDSETTQEEVGNALLYTGIALGGVATTIGFLVFLKGKGDIFKFLKPKSTTTPFSGETKEIQVGKAGEIGSDSISFNGKHYKLPEGYTVSAVNEGVSILEGENTKILGKGSQGSVFVVKKGEVKKIIKLDNVMLAEGGDKVSAGDLQKIEKVFQKEDVDVAKSMLDGFQNPMDAKLEKVMLGEVEIPVVVKDFIEGSTLKKALENGSLFHDTPQGLRMRADLEFGLFQRMAQGKKVYPDLNPGNLVWSEKEGKWIVVDARPPVSVSSEQKALSGNFNSFKSKLSVNWSGTVWSRDGIRVLLSDVAKYSPVYGSSEVKLVNDSLLMDQLKRMKTTIAAQVESAVIEPVKLNEKILKSVHIGDARNDIIQANKQRLLSNRNWLIGVATVGGLAVTTALVGSFLNLVDKSSQCQDVLKAIGKSKQAVASTLEKIHALQAFYLKGTI